MKLNGSKSLLKVIVKCDKILILPIKYIEACRIRISRPLFETVFFTKKQINYFKFGFVLFYC